MKSSRKKAKLFSSDSFIAISDYVSLSLIAFIFFPVLLFIIELYLKVGGETKWVLPVLAAVAVPVVYLKLIEDKPRWAQFAAVLLFVIAVAKAFFIASLFYDDTSDGMAYHADGILLLLKGVNPIYQWMHGFDDIWTNHYPKALWYFASIIIHATGNYNIGKSYNPLLIYTVFFYIVSVMLRRKLSFGNALLAAFALSLNPVAISQFSCFYVDGALASLMTLVVFSTLMLSTKPNAADKAFFLIASCLLINIKFTGAAYLFIIYATEGAFLVWSHYNEPKVATLVTEPKVRVIFAPVIVVALVGGLVMGFNPYIQNTLKEGNPLFPLFGNKGGRDIIAAQSPRSFNEDHTPVVDKALMSIFSKSENVIYQHGTAEPELKMPFSVSDDELKVFAYNDVRIGGWGVLFGSTLLLSMLLCLFFSSWREHQITILIIAIVGTMVINPGSWWARYAPQAALLPLLIALPSLSSHERWQKISAQCIFVLMIINSALIVPYNLAYVFDTTKHINRQIDTMVQACGRGEYEISGTKGYHYEQLFWGKGITLNYVEKDLAKAHEDNVYPLITSVADARLYKKGCTPSP